MKRTNAVMVRLDDAQVRELDALASAVGIPASTRLSPSRPDDAPARNDPGA
jgi:predicted transcriptional regulator